MGTTANDVTCVLDARAELGECPVWSQPEQALYWVDIHAPAMYRLDPATGATRDWPMPSRIGSFGLREQAGAWWRWRRLPCARLRDRRTDA
jgi:sugar lactone lactonase YvrE